MITGALKSKVDKLWQEFWQGGIANPLTVIEQITFLMFSRLLDINESRDEKRKARAGIEFVPRFSKDEQDLRWSKFIHEGDPGTLMEIVRGKVFKHMREYGGDSLFGEYMQDARLAIDKPTLLVKAIEMINDLPLEDRDTKGDLYEYLLSKLTTAGINGQFRTPRHIIQLMVRMLDPKPDERIADPACGTGGFLISAMEYIMQQWTSDEGIIREVVQGDDGQEVENIIYSADKLSAEQRQHLKGEHLLTGFDFDASMLRIAAMNLVMHGVDDPGIHYQDTLSQSFSENEKVSWAEEDAFDVVLANPPFKGSLDQDVVSPSLMRVTKTGKTELLFIAQILRMLKLGGRSATIVPQGVLFGSSNAHKSLRKALIEDNQLDAVINLPSGVFKPYAGVETAILLFTKGGETDRVWFYNVKDDGFSLDDKRDKKYDSDFAGDLPKVLEGWQIGDKSNVTSDRNDKSQEVFWVSKDNLAENAYDLSYSRYFIPPHEEIEYDSPLNILDQLDAMEEEIQGDLKELRGML